MRTNLTQTERTMYEYTFHNPSQNHKDTPTVRILHDDCADAWQFNLYNFFRDGARDISPVSGTVECAYCFQKTTAKGSSIPASFFDDDVEDTGPGDFFASLSPIDLLFT